MSVQVKLLQLMMIYACLVSVLGQIVCDIVIAGGTLASLGAVVQSPLSMKVCLVQPTDRLGGQFGDEGVWHIDFNWLYQAGYPDRTTATNPQNLHKLIYQIAQNCSMGDCWVSKSCFLYSCIEPYINQYLAPRIQSGNLTIFKNSMVKEVSQFAGIIKQVTIVSRQNLQEDCRSADIRIRDWYHPTDSQFYSKKVINLKVNKFVIEATQYGDILALSKAPFVQGTTESDICGQSIVFCLHQEYSNETSQLKAEPIYKQEDDFSLGSYSVDQVWRYRRLFGKGLNPKVNEVSLQNWNGPGNDYRDGYLFTSTKNLNFTDWNGGLNYSTIKEAQARSLRFHSWFKQQAQLPLKPIGKYFNTCNGLAKLPYIRDGRRSIGYKDFEIKGSDVTGNFVVDQVLTSTPFVDRISLGFYNMDLHSIKGCSYGSFPQSYPLPFFLPARAFTNKRVQNLIVAGRAMAQSFQASMATRTHPTQFSSGVASILMATYMIGAKLNSTWSLVECPQCIVQLQNVIRMIMPLQWSIAGKKYPSDWLPTPKSQ